MDKDRIQDTSLRQDLVRKPADWILSPTVSVNRATFVPLLGLANRDGDVILIRWLLGMNRLACRWKRADIEHYSKQLEAPAGVHSSIGSSPPYHRMKSPVPRHFLTRPSTFFTSNHPDEAFTAHALDVDLEPKLPSPIPRRPFNLKVHVDLLRRDLFELRGLEIVIAKCYTRLCDRTRESLDRRVQSGQGIYLRHEGDRVVVDETYWNQIRDADSRMSRRNAWVNDVLPS